MTTRRWPWHLLGRASVATLLAFGVAYACAQVAGIAPESQDSHAYFLADPWHPYVRATVGGDYAFLYSPAFAQAIEPLRLMGWRGFDALWTLLLVSCLAWTAGPLGLPLLAFQPVLASIALGNIELPIAAAIVAGFRRPAVWSFVLLSKVTPAVGLVWFAVRREWGALAAIALVTGLAAAVSIGLAPQLWAEWFRVLDSNQVTPVSFWTLPGPLWLRAAMGVGVVAWGAGRDRRWTVPVAAAIALPVPWGTLFAVLAAGCVGVFVHDDDGSQRLQLAGALRRVGLRHVSARLEATATPR